MAPKRAHRNDPTNSVNHVNQPDNSTIHTTQTERQWDGQLYQKILWYLLNLRDLLQAIPEARQYFVSGVIVGTKTDLSVAHVQNCTSMETT